MFPELTYPSDFSAALYTATVERDGMVDTEPFSLKNINRIMKEFLYMPILVYIYSHHVFFRLFFSHSLTFFLLLSPTTVYMLGIILRPCMTYTHNLHAE